MRGEWMKRSGLACLLVLAMMTGCSAPLQSGGMGSGQMAIERKARDCYEHAVAYMGQGHYLLARQQFSEAAAMAMSQQLHDDALAGLARADKIIAGQR